jgi:hypothetical protein
MTLRNDDRIEINLQGQVEHSQQKDIRSFLLDTWKAESPGKQYRYFVETLQNGKRIYLERPGRLNKGCDFVICVEDLLLYNNGNDKPPKHDDILADLRDKAQSNAQGFVVLLSMIERVYRCEKIDDILPTSSNLNFNTGWTCEIVIKLLKWFFIEQDITYWNRTARTMLFNGIKNIAGK